MKELNVRQSCRIPKTWLSGGALPPSRPKCATASEPCSLSKIPLRLAKADQIEQVGSVTSVHTQLLRDTGIKACHERGSVTLRQSELKKTANFFVVFFVLSKYLPYLCHTNLKQ
jgi:hypothetical protein